MPGTEPQTFCIQSVRSTTAASGLLDLCPKGQRNWLTYPLSVLVPEEQTNAETEKQTGRGNIQTTEKLPGAETSYRIWKIFPLSLLNIGYEAKKDNWDGKKHRTKKNHPAKPTLLALHRCSECLSKVFGSLPWVCWKFMKWRGICRVPLRSGLLVFIYLLMVSDPDGQ